MMRSDSSRHEEDAKQIGSRFWMVLGVRVLRMYIHIYICMIHRGSLLRIVPAVHLIRYALAHG